MTDEAGFLAAISAVPEDNAPRLVYADWLDEQGRPGGDFLRIECELAGVDPAVDHWWSVFIRLQDVSHDLDEDWIAAVSRVPTDQIFARFREIQGWLRRRWAVAEVPAGALRWQRPSPPVEGLWKRVRRLLTRAPEPAAGPLVEPDPEWAAAHMRPGDELWEYDTGGDSWAYLCGEMGYAIVRDGRVVDFQMVAMN
jgi:uncharacterized protein (TIGR02996 family)